MDIDDDVRRRLEEAESLSVGGPCTDSQATLSIYADDLDPEFVTATLKCSPTKSRRKGEGDPDRPRIRPAPIGQWFLQAPDDLAFERKIQYLLESTTDSEEAWRSLAATHQLELRAAVFLRSWTEGFDLSNDALAEIAKRKWSFALSMYSAEGEEILQAFLDRSKTNKDPDAS